MVNKWRIYEFSQLPISKYLALSLYVIFIEINKQKPDPWFQKKSPWISGFPVWDGKIQSVSAKNQLKKCNLQSITS